MPQYEDSKYEVFQLSGLPPVVFGETVVIAVGIHTDGPYFKGEYHVLIQRPTATLHSGVWRFEQSDVPTDLLTVDTDFMLKESVLQAENFLADRLIARAGELNADRLLGERIALTKASHPFVRMKMYGQFEDQLNELPKRTDCGPLHRYLLALRQVGRVQQLRP